MTVAIRTENVVRLSYGPVPSLYVNGDEVQCATWMGHGINADGSEFVDLELVAGSGAEVVAACDGKAVATHRGQPGGVLDLTPTSAAVLRVGDQHVPVTNLQVRYDPHEYVVIHCRLPAPLWRIDCVAQQDAGS